MRVLIYTHVFPPNVGGVETYARLLSELLAKQTGPMGTERIEVTVVTHSPAESGYDAQFSFRFVRQPAALPPSEIDSFGNCGAARWAFASANVVRPPSSQTIRHRTPWLSAFAPMACYSMNRRKKSVRDTL